MHILVTNDDGISAPGLLALARELIPLGKVTVLAPDRNWSASGHVKTMHRPLRVREVALDEGLVAYSSDGAPSDCVALALLGFLKEKVDLVVSGINPNANLGHDVTYSGTVTAAMEGAIWGLPAIAVSLDSPPVKPIPLEYGPAARAAARIARVVMENALEKGLLLNVNVPYLSDEQLRGIRLTRLGLRVYRDELVQRVDPQGVPYYWIGGETPTGVAEAGNDFAALSEGYISMTPLHLDMTSYRGLDTLQTWDWQPAGGAQRAG